MNTRLIGKVGENKAQKYLEKQGYKVIETNFSSKFGEIDLIAFYKEYLVFIEVKSRKTHDFCSGVYAIDAKKRLRIIKTAKYYMYKNNIEDKDIRFDIVLIEDQKISLIKNAFLEDTSIF